MPIEDDARIPQPDPDPAGEPTVNVAETPSSSSKGTTDGDTLTNAGVRLVAVGASAGGLEPFERFFHAMPNDTGLSFVVLQHLSPDFRSVMDELLARHSEMTIHKIVDGLAVKPNAIYLNSPRSDVTISDGVFRHQKLPPGRTLDLPINRFFESLADDCAEAAIGVILSGTGSDGTGGCKAIKEAGGVVLVQDPESAEFTGMPTSVIYNDLADAIAVPEKLPGLILDYLKGKPLHPPLEKSPARPETAMARIFQMLLDTYGTDFNHYKMSTLERRIRRRSDMLGTVDMVDYVARLDTDSKELEALYGDLLIEVTSFFRDQSAYGEIERSVIPALGSIMSEDRQIRVWVPGCASGEEAYSLAILFADYAEEHGVPLNVKILATDIHQRSLSMAASGFFSESSVKGLSAERLDRHFEREGDGYRISADLRRLVVFAAHNILRDPPFTRMDLVSCRNVLIYFTDESQDTAISVFHFSLGKDGYLFLGPSETVGKLGSEFETVNQRWRIFRKTRDIRFLKPGATFGRDMREDHVPVPDRPNPTSVSASGARRAYSGAIQTLLQRYAPAGFLVNLRGELAHVLGDPGPFIHLEPGAFSGRIVDLIRTDLKPAVTAGLEFYRSALTPGSDKPFARHVLSVNNEGDPLRLLIRMEMLAGHTDADDHLLLTIEEREGADRPDSNIAEDTPESADTSIFRSRISELEGDLRATEENLRTMIEELETSNEELQATNEELMASNEELQSTNEELHSVNEELYTVSGEHQRKIDELVALTHDMDHLLKSTDIGTIFLDADLCIRRFTPASARAFNLMSQDIGRPIEHITSRFVADDLLDQIKAVRESATTHERSVLLDNRHYLLRILPFKPAEDDPTAVVIAMIDVDEQVQAQERINALAAFHSSVLADVPDYILRWRRSDGIITYCNTVYAAMEDGNVDDICGRHIASTLKGERYETLQADIARLAPGDVVRRKIQTKGDDGTDIWRENTVRAIGDGAGAVVEYQTTGHDVTADVRYRDTLEALIETTEDVDSDYEARITALLGVARSYFESDLAMIWKRDGDDLVLESMDGDAKSLKAGKRLTTDGSLAGLVARTGRLSMIADVPGSKHAKLGQFGRRKIHSHVGIPIALDGKLHGVATFLSFSPRSEPSFSEMEAGFARLFGQWTAYKIERRKQLRNLMRSEQELERIVNNVPARIWYKDDSNHFLRINQTAAESMGVTVADATGADGFALFPDRAEEDHAEDLEVLNANAAKLGLIEQYTPRAGAEGWARTDKVPFIDEDSGERRLLVVSSDITALKEQEFQLLALNAQLEVQRTEYFKLYRNTPVMMHSIGDGGQLLEVSDTWLERLGYTRSEVIKRKSTEFMTPASKGQIEGVALPEFRAKGYCTNVPCQFVSKDGTVLDIEMSGVADTSDPNSQSLLCVLIDVTDRNAAWAGIENANAELEQANDSLRKFAYVASHDLQEPLRKIRQFSDLLVQECAPALEGDGSYFLSVISNSASRMSALIRDLLSFSKASNRPLHKEKTALSEMLDQVVSDLEMPIRDADAKVTVDALPETACDRTLAVQLFTNLVSNGIKYRAPDRKPRIRVTTEETKKTVRIIVSDNGIGFDQKHAATIFEPFNRLHGNAEFTGSGIGLAICKAACERHGWRISA
ncbi:MAG: CheR family methyltransferase, partial [Pseudomonadota bacterium]